MRPSRTAIQTRRHCQAKRYWGFDFMGSGLEPRTASLPLIGGQRDHAALARIVMGENVEQVLAEVSAQYREEASARGVSGTWSGHLEFLISEQLALFEGLMRGWVKFRLPLILAEYEPISAEQEWVVDMGDGFELPLRLDLLLRHRGDGLLYIRDFKGLPYVPDGWRERYLHDEQTVLYCHAVERHTGEYVAGIEYEGLVKGKRGTYKTGAWTEHDLQQSPLCYGYAIEGKDGGVVYQSEYTKVKGSRKFATWQEFDDYEDWLQHIEEPVWRGLFATTGLIAPTAHERVMTLHQVKSGETAYQERLGEIADLRGTGAFVAEAVAAVLERNPSACYAYGSRHACPFIGLCYDGLDPMAEDSGLSLRIDHHSEPEEPQLEEAA